MSAQDATDEALVAELRHGRVDALAELYARHASLLYALALRILADEQEAQDLLHDVFLEIWEKAADFQPARGKVRTWMLIRTRSRALDRKTSARIARRASEGGEAPREDRELASSAERMSVRTALEGLPPDVRQVLELSYFAGMTAPEIAARVGAPEGTIRSRLARGLRMLEQLLARDGSAG